MLTNPIITSLIMKLFKKLFFLFSFCLFIFSSGQGFVKTKNGQFTINNQPYYYIGANYWYASYLGLEKDPDRGIKRLERELDFLKKNNVTNLRVLVGAEGAGAINGVKRVEPAYQTEAGVFNDDLLKGLDIFMNEIAKRDMKAVLFLSNNWEWSGGWLQYLNWNGLIDTPTMERALNWDELRDYTSQFYSCKPCVAQYHEQVKRVINRKNTVNGKKYKKDPALMAWQIANEPRPMRPAAIPSFKNFIKETTALIKSLDKKHLVSIGSEGEMGSETMDVFKDIHADKNVDYLTIHIWPKNWSWLDIQDMEGSFERAKNNTVDYMLAHEKVADELKKPIILEEFGFPRDGHSYDIKSSTILRDRYYEATFKLFDNSRKRGGTLSGIQFWSFGGESRPIPGQIFWKSGDDYMGDPPMEEQGLNAVFDSDTSTWELIRRYSK